MVAVWSALEGDHDAARAKVMEMKSLGYYVPNYLLRRLQQVKDQGGK